MTSPSSIRKCFVSPNALISRCLSQSPGLPTASSSTMATEEISGQSTVMTLSGDQLQTNIATSIKEATKVEKRKKDIEVSKEIQNEVHKAVSHLGEVEKSWDFSVSFRDGENPDFTKKIMKVIANKLGEFNKDMAYKACGTYFLTLKAQDKKIKKGQMEETRKQQRRRQRRSNARSRRSTTQKKMKSVSQEDRNNVELILATNDYMSSEDSWEKSESDSDDEKTKVLKKRKVPWRSDYVNNWMKILDEKAEERAKKLRKGGGNLYNREECLVESRREEPEDAPEFAVNDQ